MILTIYFVGSEYLISNAVAVNDKLTPELIVRLHIVVLADSMPSTSLDPMRLSSTLLFVVPQGRSRDRQHPRDHYCLCGNEESSQSKAARHIACDSRVN